MRRVIETHFANRVWFPMWLALETLAYYWALTDQPERSAVLLGHVEAHATQPGPPSFQQLRRDTTQHLRTLDLTPSRERGAAMSHDELVRYALDEL